jgi:hypothetical protein
MKHARFSAVAAAVALVAWAGAGSALAAIVRGEPPPSPGSVVSRGIRPAPATLDLVNGRITAVDRANHTLKIGTMIVSLHPSKLQIFGPQGGRASVSELQPGTQIRFALEPGAADPRRVVLIYIQGK